MARLTGKTALVTGSGSGIGEAVAQRFAAEGARVVIADRDTAAAERVAASLGDTARAVTMDISDEAQVSAAFASLEADGWSPNVVVANAGVQLFGHDAKVADLDLDVWRRTVDINLTGTFLTAGRSSSPAARPASRARATTSPHTARPRPASTAWAAPSPQRTRRRASA
jgi:3-oxoacyl-[acyl-carrier protein] reductase